VIAKQDIAEGEEITISYVDPEWPGHLRRDTLKRDYGFECHCPRCVEELKNGNGEGNGI
jgi:SET domain-containing protein